MTEAELRENALRFVDRCLEAASDGDLTYGREMWDWAEEYGLVAREKYDPKRHGPIDDDVLAAVPWLVKTYTFPKETNDDA